MSNLCLGALFGALFHSKRLQMQITSKYSKKLNSQLLFGPEYERTQHCSSGAFNHRLPHQDEYETLYVIRAHISCVLSNATRSELPSTSPSYCFPSRMDVSHDPTQVMSTQTYCA
jgi:hypothetical protein